MTLEDAIQMCLPPGVTEAEVLGRGRTARIAAVRRNVMRLLYSNRWPIGRIAAYLQRDRTTVMHAVGRRPGHRRR